MFRVLATGLALLSLVEGRVITRAVRDRDTQIIQATNGSRAERDTITVQAPGFSWGVAPVRGVNIGGW
jgi:hypothetical protein